MKNFLDVISQVTDFIVGKEEESLMEKKRRTIGFAPNLDKPKRKYKKRKKK
jgi:hypothetical protein